MNAEHSESLSREIKPPWTKPLIDTDQIQPRWLTLLGDPNNKLPHVFDELN